MAAGRSASAAVDLEVVCHAQLVGRAGWQTPALRTPALRARWRRCWHWQPSLVPPISATPPRLPRPALGREAYDLFGSLRGRGALGHSGGIEVGRGRLHLPSASGGGGRCSALPLAGRRWPLGRRRAMAVAASTYARATADRAAACLLHGWRHRSVLCSMGGSVCCQSPRSQYHSRPCRTQSHEARAAAPQHALQRGRPAASRKRGPQRPCGRQQPTRPLRRRWLGAASVAWLRGGYGGGSGQRAFAWARGRRPAQRVLCVVVVCSSSVDHVICPVPPCGSGIIGILLCRPSLPHRGPVAGAAAGSAAWADRRLSTAAGFVAWAAVVCTPQLALQLGRPPSVHRSWLCSLGGHRRYTAAGCSAWAGRDRRASHVAGGRRRGRR